MSYKIPISVLVVIHTLEGEYLLIERVGYPNYWQSVTGSIGEGEKLIDCAQREVFEETGISEKIENFFDWQIAREFEIFPHWRHRYAPGVTHNTENMFSLVVPRNINIKLAENEHSAYQWCNKQMAINLCFSWTNKEAIDLVNKKISKPLP